MDAGASQKRARPNLAAVAALAGVSPSTASLAFSGAGPVSEATRAKVLAAAEQLDYGGPDPRAQSLRRGRSGIVGVVMEDRLREAFRDPMNIAMLDGLADALGTAGLGLLLLTEPGSGGPELSVTPMDAVVLVGCSTQLDRSVVTLRQRGIPVVAIEAEHMPDVLAIDLDNRDATARAARHLKDLGHERVALVTLPLAPDHERGPLTAERIAASTGGSVRVLTDPVEAVTGADVVVTDTWVSMGREEEKAVRLAELGAYQVTTELMEHAVDDAIFLHCLPADREYEVASEVIDGPRSVVWDEAENRLHAQKALLVWLLRQS